MAPADTDEGGRLGALSQRPDDLALREEHARWLVARGGPSSCRGELALVQLERLRRPLDGALLQRELELTAACRAACPPPSRGRIRFCLGFVDTLDLADVQSFDPASLRALLEQPAFALLRGLRLPPRPRELVHGILETTLASPARPVLRCVRATAGGLDLSLVARFPRLEELALGALPKLRELVGGPARTAPPTPAMRVFHTLPLVSLEVAYVQEAQDVADVLAGPWDLRHLSLQLPPLPHGSLRRGYRPAIAYEAFVPLLGDTVFPSLRRLGLHGPVLTGMFLRQLEKSPRLRCLEELELTGPDLWGPGEAESFLFGYRASFAHLRFVSGTHDPREACSVAGRLSTPLGRHVDALRIYEQVLQDLPDDPRALAGLRDALAQIAVDGTEERR